MLVCSNPAKITTLFFFPVVAQNKGDRDRVTCTVSVPPYNYVNAEEEGARNSIRLLPEKGPFIKDVHSEGVGMEAQKQTVLLKLSKGGCVDLHQ